MPLPVRIPRPSLTTILLYLLAGAFLNWPIAWAIAAFAQQHGTLTCAALPNPLNWPEPVPSDWPALSTFITPAQVREYTSQVGLPPSGIVEILTSEDRRWVSADEWSGFASRATSLYAVHARGSPRLIEHFHIETSSCGFPFHATHTRHVFDSTGTRITTPVWNIPFRGDTLSLPLAPAWSGLIPNTVIYAAILYALTALPRFFITRHRRRVGLCTVCRYEVASLPTCPECGTATPLHRRNAAPE